MRGLVVDATPQADLFEPRPVETVDPVAAWCRENGVEPVSIFNRPERGKLLLVAATWNRAWCVWIAEETGCLQHYSDAEHDTQYRVHVQPWKQACTSEPGVAMGVFGGLLEALEFAAGYCTSAGAARRLGRAV